MATETDETIYGYCIECETPKESDTFQCPNCGSELAVQPSEVPKQKHTITLSPKVIVDCIEDSNRPFATAEDIGEWVGVTKQTVLNKEDIFVGDVVERDRVGKTFVYYPSESN